MKCSLSTEPNPVVDERHPVLIGKKVPLIIGAALFMQTMDGHSIATILPVAAETFGTNPVALNVAITVYFAAAAAFLPVSGWFADRFGTRVVFQGAIVAFLIGSAICALAPSAPVLFMGRAVQGMAGAGLLPVGRLLIIRTARKRDLMEQLTYLTLPPLLGPMIGPVLAGAAGTFGSWRWIFILNLPIGLIGLYLIGRFVPQVREQSVPALDWRGAILSSLFFVSIVLLLNELSHGGTIASASPLLTIAALSGGGYIFHAGRVANPILDLSLFRIPTYSAGTIGGVFVRLSIGAEPFLYALLFQVTLGLTAFISGLLIATTSVGMMVMRSLSVRIIRMFGFRQILIFTTIAGTVTLAVPLLFDRSTPLVAIAAYLALRGLVRSTQLNAVNAITYADPPRDKASAASSLAATIQQICQGGGTALAASLIAWLPMFSTLEQPQAIRLALPALGLVGLISLVYFGRLRDDAGANLSGRGRNPEQQPEG